MIFGCMFRENMNNQEIEQKILKNKKDESFGLYQPDDSSFILGYNRQAF